MRLLNKMLNYKFLCAFLCSVLTMFVSGKNPEQLKPVGFERVKVSGELYQRATKNFDRLETDIYYPENVFPAKHHPSSADWPGDKEGRTILGLVMEARATHRTPKYLDEMIRIFPEKLNKKGYLGAVQGETIDEQQLSGHGWLLRGLCEYYLWKKDPKVKTYIIEIINNLVLTTAGHHKEYPINPAERVAGTGGMSGSAANVVKGWKLSTDVGCDFIFMDGVVQAYGLFPSARLKSLVDEMIARFLEMDLVGMKAQTHATLTGLRAVLRYAEITGRKDLLPEVEKRYKLYRELAMTENYENFNWFERPEWTEPCAIVDSYLLAVQLWQHTQSPKYMEDAHLIYYNAIGHTQRANGGFGCDNCPGPVDNAVSVKADEAFWCCTMRGGEGLARAVEYSWFQNKDTLVVPSFYTGSVDVNQKDSSVTISQKTEYPFGNKVVLTIDKMQKPGTMTLKLFAPSWIKQPVVTVNGQPVKFEVKNQFVIVSAKCKAGDKIEYSFTMKSGVETVANVTHTPTGKSRLFYGPLLLGYEGDAEIEVPRSAKVVRMDNGGFQIEGTGIQLTPVYHLMDAKVCSGAYKKQLLFSQDHH
ncbi:MAG: glycoside hydrolase family 127 protein [Bacteroidota bacterium]|nr:glycoside hydrolase family 127 protein [Bacteroidota bacterium]